MNRIKKLVFLARHYAICSVFFPNKPIRPSLNISIYNMVELRRGLLFCKLGDF